MATDFEKYRGCWPPQDLVAKLIEAAEILLDQHNYDGHGHEQIRLAVRLARTTDWQQMERLAEYESVVDEIRRNFHRFQNSPYRGEWDQWAYRYGDVFRMLSALPDRDGFPMLVKASDVGLPPWIKPAEEAS